MSHFTGMIVKLSVLVASALHAQSEDSMLPGALSSRLDVIREVSSKNGRDLRPPTRRPGISTDQSVTVLLWSSEDDPEAVLVLLFGDLEAPADKRRFAYATTRQKQGGLEVIVPDIPNYVFIVPVDRSLAIAGFKVGRLFGNSDPLLKNQHEKVLISDALRTELLTFTDRLNELAQNRKANLISSSEERKALSEAAAAKIANDQVPTPEELAQFLAMEWALTGGPRLSIQKTSDGMLVPGFGMTSVLTTPPQDVKTARTYVGKYEGDDPLATGWWTTNQGIFVVNLYAGTSTR